MFANIDGCKLHKSIDLISGKCSEVQPNQHISTAATQISITKGSVSGDNNILRRSSIFSRSTLNSNTSFMFRSLQRARSNGPVPKVSIQQLIKKKANLYWDEALASNFDDLMESGYTMVVNKKHERDALKECEDDLRGQAAGLEKEIIPEINKLFNLKEAVKHQKNLKSKYEGEIDAVKREINDQRHEITKRVEDIMDENQRLINKIKSLELENNDLRSDIIISKTIHKKEKEELDKRIKVKKEEQSKLVDKLTDLKAIYDKKKKDQADKLRKMENKSKMFMGILKH